MPPSAEALLRSIVRITDHQDSRKFRQSMDETFREIAPIQSLRFVRPIFSGGATSFDLLDQDGPYGEPTGGPAKLPADLRALLTEARVTELTEKGRLVVTDPLTILLPVIYRGELLEIVVVRGDSFPADAMPILEAFVRLYRNFLALLNESERDALTGLYNRKTLEVRLREIVHESGEGHRTRKRSPDEQARAAGALQRSYLAIFDIDHFKRINDSFGHLFGDEVIILVARLMKEVFRREDVLFRFGGEEFIAVLTAIDDADAMVALERFRKAVAAHRFPQVQQVTISIGFTEIRPSDVASSAVGRADQALYEAKSQGRNRTVDFAELHLEETAPAGEIDLF